MNEKLLQSTQAILMGFLALIIYSCIVQLWHFDLYVPLDLRVDAVLTSAFIKTVIQVGNYWSATQYVGYPELYLWKQYPAFSPILFCTVWVFSQFTHNYALVLNLTYLTSIFLVSCSSFLVFRYVGINTFFAMVAALLYCFLPYHFLRGEAHLTLSAYFMVPAWIYLCLEHSRGTLITNEKKWLPRMTVWKVLLLMLLATDLIYFWFFGLLCLLITGMIRSIQIGRFQPAIHAIVITMFVGMIAITLSIPSISYILTYGFNPQNVSFLRSFADTEYYGLKIINLLLPINNHYIDFMRHTALNYAARAPLYTENLMAALGLIGSIGFLLLIFVSLAGLLCKRFSTLLRELSVLNLVCLLIANIGGFGTFIALLLFAGVRAYNRISVFIAFFSIAAFFIVLQNRLSFSNKQQKWVYFIGVGILIVGLLDQSGKNPLGYKRANYISMQSSYLTQKNFVNAIESKMPIHTAIFELPNLYWGEAANSIIHIDLFSPYLQSNTSYWSFGAMNGNPVSDWQHQVGQSQGKDQFDQLIFAGFTGLYIDRNGYADHGAKIENAINLLLKNPPLVSADLRYAFYDLRDYKLTRQKEMGAAAYEKQIQETKIKLSVRSTVEDNVDQAAKLLLQNYTASSLPLKMSFSLSSRSSSPILANIQGGGIKNTIKISAVPSVFSAKILLPPGKTEITISANTHQSSAKKSSVDLNFVASNITLTSAILS